MVTYYKKLKNYNEIHLINKKQNGLKQSNNEKSSTLPWAHGNNKNKTRLL